MDMKQSRVILQLCADTGSDTKPYRDAGYEVILVGKDIGVENYHPPKDVYGIIANPVCTEFSTARSNGKKYHDKCIRTKYKGVLKPFAQKVKDALESGEAEYRKTQGKNIYVYTIV